MANAPRVDPTELLASVEQAEAVISNLRKHLTQHLSSLVGVLDETLPEPGHIWHDCKVNGHVGNRPEEHCLACDGGLSGCVVCGQWEGAIEDVCPGQKPNPLLGSRFDAKITGVTEHALYGLNTAREGPVRAIKVQLHHGGTNQTFEVEYRDPTSDRYDTLVRASGWRGSASWTNGWVAFLPGKVVRAEMDAQGNVDVVGPRSSEASW